LISLPAADVSRDLTAHPNVLRRIFSFPLMLVSLLAMLAALTVRWRFDDLDMWWQLKTGEVIWTTHSIPTTDIFSYTTNHHAWVPHEWLAQVLIYGAYRWGAYSGLMLWFLFFAVALIVAGYVLCWVYSGNPKAAFLGGLIVWLFSTTVLAIRPQLIGYLLLTVELLLLHLGSTRSAKWFFGLPPLFAVWVNCHGSFLFGLLTVGVFLLCSSFEFRMGSLVCVRWDMARRRMLMLALLLSTAALFLNPVGLRQIFYPLNTVLQQHIVVSQIEEWQPLGISDPRGFALLAIVGGIFLFVIVRRAELSLTELLLLVVSAVFALSHQRMAVVFGVVAAPVASRLFSSVWDNYDVKRDLPVANAGLMVLAVLIVVFTFPSGRNLAEQVERGSPVKAVQFIKNARLSGPMLNAFDYGGYVIWALPEHPNFVDGRADVFEWSGVLEEFSRWATLQSDPNALLSKYGVNFCLLERRSAIAHVFSLMRDWKLVYSDDDSVVFVRSTP